MPQERDDLADEILRLRDWRHDTQPAVESLERLYPELARKVGKVERRVNALLEQDRVAARLAQERAARRQQSLSAADKVLVTLLAAPGLIALVLRLTGHGG
jgi:hypothetical protein